MKISTEALFVVGRREEQPELRVYCELYKNSSKVFATISDQGSIKCKIMPTSFLLAVYI